MVHQPFTFSTPRAKREVKRFRSKSESFISDGLLSSFITSEEFQKFGDEQNHYRDFSLQTLIRAEAVELLRPLGAMPYDQLRAADFLGEVATSFESLHNDFTALKDSFARMSEPVINESK